MDEKQRRFLAVRIGQLNQAIAPLHDFAKFTRCRAILGKASWHKCAPKRHTSHNCNE
jgi:hypothetical protein